jgi:RimJ/RimL family protein N-acetyltransferase
MEYQEYITPAMQEKWFEKIDNDNNFFFIIEHEGKEVGLINVKDIDYEQKTGEGGIFIYDDSYLNSTLSFSASLCSLDFCFEILKLNRIIAHILKNNKRAIQFNKMLGFGLQPNQENVLNQLYFLEKEKYLEKYNFISKFLN